MSPKQLLDFLREKKEAKKKLIQALSFDQKPPLLAVILDGELNKSEKKSLDQLLKACKELENIQVVLLADSYSTHKLAKNIIELPYSEKNRHKLIEAADMGLAFQFSDLEEMLIHGTIPIAISGPKAQNYDPNSEQGNSFTYSKTSPWSIFAALVRASETFRFPYDWKNIVRQGIQSVSE